jgi:hypothetical protein
MKNDLVWGCTLIVIGISTIILAILDIIGTELPDAGKIVILIIDLIAIPVLIFTTVRKLRKKK